MLKVMGSGKSYANRKESFEKIASSLARSFAYLTSLLRSSYSSVELLMGRLLRKSY